MSFVRRFDHVGVTVADLDAAAAGIVRSAFLVGPDGALRAVWYKISPKDTPVKLLAALEAGR